MGVSKMMIAKVKAIDTEKLNKLASEIGLGRRTNTVLQASFFYLNQGIMPYAEAQAWMKKYAEKAGNL